MCFEYLTSVCSEFVDDVVLTLLQGRKLVGSSSYV